MSACNQDGLTHCMSPLKKGDLTAEHAEIAEIIENQFNLTMSHFRIVKSGAAD